MKLSEDNEEEEEEEESEGSLLSSEPSLLSDENTDDLFSSEAVTYAEESKPSPVAPEPESEALISDDAFVSETPVEAPVEPAPVEQPKAEDKKSAKKDKKEKGKKEKEKKEKEKKDKEKRGPDAPKGFKPMAFVPKGNRSSAYAPTRSYRDDLFLDAEEEHADTLSVDKPKADDSVAIPNTPETKGGEDELVIAKSSGFSLLDDDADEKKDGDGDLL